MATEPHRERPGPAEFRDPVMRDELKRAWVWLGLATAMLGVFFLAEPLLLIIGGLVFAAILDGGARLLGRLLPIGRGWRLGLVAIAGFGFVGWTMWFAGTTLAEQAEALRVVINVQIDRVLGWATDLGLFPRDGSASLGNQLLGSVGRLTSVVGSAVGALSAMLMIIVIGLFIAFEPRLYDHGVAWMLPLRHRAKFYVITSRVAHTLRRLMAGRIVGMIFEGLFTWLMLWIGGVPMAALLGLLTGVLAFIPNIGAIVSGLLMVAVGFSAGTDQGIWAIFVYFLVQNVDGYLVVPYIARRTVDLAPALVLAAQLLLGALFGILGVLLADPIVASLKVALEELSKYRAAEQQALEAGKIDRGPG